jgi:hypothetical protein
MRHVQYLFDALLVGILLQRSCNSKLDPFASKGLMRYKKLNRRSDQDQLSEMGIMRQRRALM